jgi:hypothetical protein
MAGKAGAFALTLALAASGSLAFAQSDKTEFAAEKPRFVSFANFVESTRSANSNDFLARADSKVRTRPPLRRCAKAFSTGIKALK